MAGFNISACETSALAYDGTQTHTLYTANMHFDTHTHKQMSLSFVLVGGANLHSSESQSLNGIPRGLCASLLDHSYHCLPI